ncbi:hypothetical protein [Litorisediminicola beolgyonensis]|uniref:Glycosyltransferase n=1 Tax=Litorisediminicola beolgyonensis TaxID=1173614 RepID=A0ABW3ZMV2_9RHOB
MIHIVTTIGALHEADRLPIANALRRNLSLPGVSRIVVLSEADAGWLREIDDSGQLAVEHISARPTFGDLIAQANAELSLGAQAVCICNSDISLASQDDASQIVDLLSILNADGGNPAVLALTRHEFNNNKAELTLYHDENGLPNTISTDLWAFSSPLKVSRNLFYPLSEMNSDMMLIHDLVSSGHRLFNPCLDIIALHHEETKQESFYNALNARESTKSLLYRHACQNHIDPWNYFGVPWTRSDWLRVGYRPSPNSTHGRQMLLAVPKVAEVRLASEIADLAVLSQKLDLEIQILTDFDPDMLVRQHATTLAAAPRMWFARPRNGVLNARRAFLEGAQSNFERVAFVSDPARIDETLLAASDAVFVTLHPAPLPQVPPRFGCTLVTSVFRSDRFIAGFLANCRDLRGYDRMIEHVFLVSNLSATELDCFDSLLKQKCNALIIWHKKDPGLYECWNIGIRVARTDYVSNANVDDLRDPDHVVALVQDLETHPDCYVAATALNPFTEFPAEGTLPEDRSAWYSDQAGRFGFFDIALLSETEPPKLVAHNMPHCMPVWRRELHMRFGWFDEDRYGTYADWAFWLKVLQFGGQGWMNERPLGFYFVNPTSHNRRGTDLERLHNVVEEDFVETFVARRDRRPPVQPSLSGQPRKLILHGKNSDFGQHRNSFNSLIHALAPLERAVDDKDGVLFIPFLERQFVWGTNVGEAGSIEPAPIERPWIGILHVPFEAPDWFNPAIHPENFMASELFQRSRHSCRGILTLARDLEADLRQYDPDLPTLSVLHPTSLDVCPFDLHAYRANPTVVQVGDWLRRLQAIHRLRAIGHKRVMLLKHLTSTYLDTEIAIFGDHRDPAVEMVDYISNDNYDSLLSSAAVLCLLYGTAANNVVIECIARATPILINPLPAVVEYLGRNYPLYVADEAEADEALAQPESIEAAHTYLLKRRNEIDLSYARFCRDVAASNLYATL